MRLGAGTRINKSVEAAGRHPTEAACAGTVNGPMGPRADARSRQVTRA